MKLTALLIRTAEDDFIPRRPNWDAISFGAPLFKWIFGAFMAIVVLYCAFKAIMALSSIAGADSTQTAKLGGQALAFALAAVAGVYFFYDLFTGLIASAA